MIKKKGRPKGQMKHYPGWDELRLAVMKQAVADYREAKCASTKTMIERWVLSCPYQLDAETCRAIVQRLREGV